MSRNCAHFLVLVLVAANMCTSAQPHTTLPTQITIHAEHSGWTSRSTNLALVLTNGVYAAGTYTVTPGQVSNLIAVAKRPWPKPATNSWPRFTIDVNNLGLTTAWIQTNYPRLLETSSADTKKEPFPNASQRQRAWLTNALANPELLSEAVRGCFGTFWTDDYPTFELCFEHNDGKIVEQMFRLSSKGQPMFMLPWEVFDGTNEFTSGNADISRAVVQILPPGFLLRDRLNGDLLQMIWSQFPNVRQVQDFIKKSVVEETLGQDTDRLLRGYELHNLWIPPGSYGRFPETFMGNLHRTNWPERLTMPIQTGIEQGIAKQLSNILSKAETKGAQLLKHEWLIARARTSKEVSVELKAEGSPDHQWLRGHMEKAGLAGFYDRIQPALQRSLGFLLREGHDRASEWAVLENGLLLYGFSGDGVLDWKPEELGFQGEESMLRSSYINRVAVLIGPGGKIKEVVQPERK